jgi:hypothetical protein
MSVTVHGRILAPWSATAIPNVSVQVGSVRTASDVDGQFVAEGVQVPYDLVVSSQFGAGLVSVYKGVTRVDPVVPFPFLGTPIWTQQGTVSLTLTGLGAADVATAAWAGDAPSGGGDRDRAGGRPRVDLLGGPRDDARHRPRADLLDRLW